MNKEFSVFYDEIKLNYSPNCFKAKAKLVWLVFLKPVKKKVGLDFVFIIVFQSKKYLICVFICYLKRKTIGQLLNIAISFMFKLKVGQLC